MLTSETISKLAGILKVSAEDLTAKISSEKEEDITLPSGDFFTDDELQRRDSGKYNEGKQAQEEMLVKNAKNKHNYDFEGKSFDAFLTHHDEKLKEKYSKNSNERVTELESDLAKMKNTHAEELKGLQSKNESLMGQFQQQRNKNILLGIMPKETTINPNAIITLFNSEFEIGEENGTSFVSKNGEKLKNDKTAEPLAINDVFNDWLVKEKYIKANPGRGGDNEFGNSGFKGNSISEFQKNWQKENPDMSLNTPKYSEDYAKWRKENKEVTA